MIVAATFATVVALTWRVRPCTATRLPAAEPDGSLRGRPNRLFLLLVNLLVITVVAMMTTPVCGAILVAGAFACRRWSAARRTARLTRRIATDFPDALDVLVLSIRAGYLPAQAIGEVRPYLPASIQPSFESVDEAMRQGLRFSDALSRLAVQLGPIARPLVDSLSAADRYGLPLAPVLERLSFEARQQRRRDSDAAARELPVRLSMPLVLCTLPSFVLLAIIPLLLGALSSLRT